MHKHSMLLLVAASGLAACGTEQAGPASSVTPGVGATAVEPTTLKLNVNGKWESLRQVGDYVQKLAGDSFKIRAGGYDLGKIPASGLALDASGGTRVVDSAGLRHIIIERRTTLPALYIRKTGDILRILGNEGNAWNVEVNSQLYNTPAFKIDIEGGAQFANCEVPPACGRNRPYDAYIWRFTTSHPGTWGTAFRLDTIDDRIVGARADNVGAEWCGTGSGPGWQVVESGKNLGSRDPNWSWLPAVPGSFGAGYYTQTVFSGGSFLATCWKNQGHEVIKISTPDGVKVITGSVPGAYSFGYLMAMGINRGTCAADSTLRWSIADTSGAIFGPYSPAQLRAGGSALRLVLEGYKPQCIP